jgi:hypothetical protein
VFVIAGYAMSAAAVCSAALVVGVSEGWSASGPAALGTGAVVCVLWVAPALLLYRGRSLAHPTVVLADGEAPELTLLVRQLSLQLQVPTPSGIELSPGCDAWLDPRPGGAVLVIGSPFLWWLRVSELRGMLAPLIAGMAAADDERITRARRFATRMGGALHALPGRRGGTSWRNRAADYCDARAELLERAVALEAVAASRLIEPAARAYAHEQINLAAAGWDRVLTRLAQPAWSSGRCPTGLNVALVGALTSLGRRDRMAAGLTLRLGERPACDLLEEPGRVDDRVSRIAAEVFDGRRVDRPVSWERYLAEIVEPGFRRRAAAVPENHPTAKLIRDLIAGGTAVDTVGVVGIVDTSPDTGADTDTDPGSSLDSEAVAAYLACNITDARLASWALDWLDGPVLRDLGGLAVPVNDFAVSVVETGGAPLAEWIAGR